MNRPVTEDDLRRPEFQGVNIDKLEWDGTEEHVVRKDRWETCVRSIATGLGLNYELNVSEVKATAEKLLDALSEFHGIPIADRVVPFSEVEKWPPQIPRCFVYKGQVYMHPPKHDGTYYTVNSAFGTQNIPPTAPVLVF